MKINKALNLVCPVTSDDGQTLYFHSMPISLEVFQRYSFVIATTFSRMLVNGLQSMGARIAAYTLQEVAEELGKWDSPNGVRDGLMNEIIRLTNIMVLTESGWETMPVELAVKQGLVAEDDFEEAKQKIVFFTLILFMARRDVRDSFMIILEGDWGMLTTSLTCTAFAASLPISIGTGSLEIQPSSLPV